MSTIIKEICLYCSNDYRQDAMWAAAYTDTAYLVVWGARATKYNDRGTKLNISVSKARSEFEKKVAEKKGKGYFEVSFGSPNYGDVHTFSSLFNLGIGPNTSPHLTSVGPAGLVVGLGQELQRVTTALQLGSGLSQVEVDSLHIRQVQIRLVAQVLGVSDNPALRLKELGEQPRQVHRLGDVEVVQNGSGQRKRVIDF